MMAMDSPKASPEHPHPNQHLLCRSSAIHFPTAPLTSDWFTVTRKGPYKTTKFRLLANLSHSTLKLKIEAGYPKAKYVINFETVLVKVTSLDSKIVLQPVNSPSRFTLEHTNPRVVESWRDQLACSAEAAEETARASRHVFSYRWWKVRTS